MTGPDDVRRALGLAAKPPALSVICPHCRAGPGEPCTTRGRRKAQPHPSRVEMAPDARVIPIRPYLPPDAPSG